MDFSLIQINVLNVPKNALLVWEEQLLIVTLVQLDIILLCTIHKMKHFIAEHALKAIALNANLYNNQHIRVQSAPNARTVILSLMVNALNVMKYARHVMELQKNNATNAEMDFTLIVKTNASIEIQIS